MYDYGWEMKHIDTEHAGGAEKNRMVDKTIHLDEGSYMAFYVSDGSHNYGDWNTAPPYVQTRWGLTLIGLDDSFTASDVAPYDDQSDKSILAQLRRLERRSSRGPLQLGNNSVNRLRRSPSGKRSEGR